MCFLLHSFTVRAVDDGLTWVVMDDEDGGELASGKAVYKFDRYPLNKQCDNVPCITLNPLTSTSQACSLVDSARLGICNVGGRESGECSPACCSGGHRGGCCCNCCQVSGVKWTPPTGSLPTQTLECHTVQIPLAAQAPATHFRWHQHPNVNNGDWALSDVRVQLIPRRVPDVVVRVTSLSPSSGPFLGGTRVRLTGMFGYPGLPLRCMFGKYEAASMNYTNATVCTARCITETIGES